MRNIIKLLRGEDGYSINGIEAECRAMLENYDKLKAENERLAKCCTQRGARMQILWGWIKGKHSHEAFLQCYPNAKKWFDEDGVPND